MAREWFFVWREGSRKPRCSSTPSNPTDVGADSKAYLSKILATHKVPPELWERLENSDGGVLDDLKRLFPAPN